MKQVSAAGSREQPKLEGPPNCRNFEEELTSITNNFTTVLVFVIALK